jgi:hypothetical protein
MEGPKIGPAALKRRRPKGNPVQPTFHPQNPDTAKRREILVSWPDVMARCRAAAATALKGDEWSWSDVEDCSAAVAAGLLERTALKAERAPMLPVMTRGSDLDILDPARILRGVPAYRPSGYPERIPLRSCAMVYLTNRAGDWRESVSAARRRDADEMLRTPVFTVDADALATLERLESEAAELAAPKMTPYRAADAARDFLTRTGAAPMARETAAWIAVFTAALSGGEHGAAKDAAEALELTPAAHRKQVSRGTAALLARGTAADYRAALGYRVAAAHRTADALRGAVLPGKAELPTGLPSRRSVDRTRRLAPEDWRANAAGKGGVLRRSDGRGSRAVMLYRAPLSCRADIRERRTRKRSPWSGTARADWTRTYSRPLTIARWANAARWTRERTYTAPMAERVARRTDAGIRTAPMVLPVPTLKRGELPRVAAAPDFPTLEITHRTAPYVAGGTGRKMDAHRAGNAAPTLRVWDADAAAARAGYVPRTAPDWTRRYRTDATGRLELKTVKRTVRKFTPSGWRLTRSGKLAAAPKR